MATPEADVLDFEAEVQRIQEDFASQKSGAGATSRRLDLRPAEGPVKPYAPDRWSPLHDIVCSLKASGVKNNKIAELVGLSQNYVSIIVNDPRGVNAIMEFHASNKESMKDVPARLQELAFEAVEVVGAQLDSADENVAQRAALGILDRAGYGKIEKKVIASAHITEEAARLIGRAADESEAVEADYSVVGVDDDE